MEPYISSPTVVEGLRIQQELLLANEIGGLPAFHKEANEEFKNTFSRALTVASIVYFPGRITQIRYLPALIRGGLTSRKFLTIYGGNLLPFPSLGTIGLGLLLKQYQQSRGGRDSKPGLPPVEPGRRPRPINPSKPTRSGSSSKPFWSDGKPKCKKGFRYDFKRKLCVKIK